MKTVAEWKEIAESMGMRDGVTLECPCGQPVAIGYIKGGGCAVHRSPTCKVFDDLEPDEYATYVRKAATEKAGGEVGV